ncbi:hypothetical protein IMSAGC004_03540 [Bacteroidaceae bacterium]|nr:hypothetical protein IMSAGC004_03540 [Bacteroidaceae bacterium]
MRAGHGYGQKTAYSCARFKKRAYLQAIVLECIVHLPCHRFHNELRRVKSRKDGRFYVLYQCAVHGFIFARQYSQRLFQTVQRFSHVVRSGSVRPDVMHILDTSKAGVSG